MNNMDLLPGKQSFFNVPVLSVKYNRTKMFNLYVDNKLQKKFGNLYFPTIRNEKRVYSTIKKTSSLYDC